MRQQIVFTLRDSAGAPKPGVASSILAEIYLDGELDNTIVPEIEHIANGDYVLSFQEPSSYEYIRIQLTCGDCLPKRFTVYPDITATTTDVASAKDDILAAIPTIPDDYAKEETLNTSKDAIIAAMPSIPQNYAKVSDLASLAKVSDVNTAKNAIITAMPNVSGLSTFNPATDKVLLADTQLESLATSSIIATAKEDILAAIPTIPDDYAKVSDIPDMSSLATEASVTAIATSLDSLPTAKDIASAVLTTNVATLEVERNEYTIKHLIMATQDSTVIEGTKKTATWVIYGGTLDTSSSQYIIAKRKLRLNDNGAITETK